MKPPAREGKINFWGAAVFCCDKKQKLQINYRLLNPFVKINFQKLGTPTLSCWAKYLY